jgi:hypothetical protein
MRLIFKLDLPRLQAYHLSFIRVSTIELWGHSRWENLREFQLLYLNLYDEGAEAVAKGHWPLLSLLVLSKNRIGDVGAAALTKGRWPLL